MPRQTLSLADLVDCVFLAALMKGLLLLWGWYQPLFLLKAFDPPPKRVFFFFFPPKCKP